MSGLEPMMLMAGVSAVGDFAGGVMQRNAAYKSSAVDEENARLAVLQGEYDAQDIMRTERRQAGQALVDLSGSGVMVGEGSARDILEQSILQGERDIQRTRMAAYGEARNYQASAADKRAQGNAALVGSLFSAVSTTLQGARDARAARIQSKSAGKVRNVQLGRTGGSTPGIGDGIIVNRGGRFLF